MLLTRYCTQELGAQLPCCEEVRTVGEEFDAEFDLKAPTVVDFHDMTATSVEEYEEQSYQMIPPRDDPETSDARELALEAQEPVPPPPEVPPDGAGATAAGRPQGDSLDPNQVVDRPAATNQLSSVRSCEVFSVRIEVAGQKLGLDINYHDGRSLLVTKVGEGPIAVYNRSAPPDALVCVGDRITTINGVSGHVSQLCEAVRKKSTMDAEITRCEERRVTLVRAPRDAVEHGLQVEPFDLCCLRLTAPPLANTLLAVHNESEPDFALQIEDCIVEVNRVRGSPAELIKALATDDRWEISYRCVQRRGKL